MVELTLQEIEEALRNAENKLLKAREKRADSNYVSQLKKDVDHFRDLWKRKTEKISKS